MIGGGMESQTDFAYKPGPAGEGSSGTNFEDPGPGSRVSAKARRRQPHATASLRAATGTSHRGFNGPFSPQWRGTARRQRPHWAAAAAAAAGAQQGAASRSHGELPTRAVRPSCPPPSLPVLHLSEQGCLRALLPLPNKELPPSTLSPTSPQPRYCCYPIVLRPNKTWVSAPP